MIRTTKCLIQIAGFLLVAILAWVVFAKGKLRCPKITNDQCPAVVFIEGHADKSHLYYAYLYGQSLHKEKIISSKYIQVTQLDNSIFLVTTQNTSKKGKVHLVKLNHGIGKLLDKNTRIRCLRTDIQLERAMLADFNASRGEIRLFELNLSNFRITSRNTLKRDQLDERFIGRLKLSPDFRHLVYVCAKRGDFPKFYGGFALRLIDLSTMETKSLVDNVNVEVHVFSSNTSQAPAFEWISDNEIIYTDMPGKKNIEFGKVLHVFSRVNIKTGEISEVLRKVLPVRNSEGSFRINPLDSKIIYNEQYVLDLDKKTLVEKDMPFSVEPAYFKEPVAIRYENIVFYERNGYCSKTWISDSGDNFAWLLHYNTTLPSHVLHAKFKGRDRSVKIAEGDYPTRVVGWIE